VDNLHSIKRQKTDETINTDAAVSRFIIEDQAMSAEDS